MAKGKRIKPDRHGTVEEQVEGMLAELRLIGFCVAKEIATLRGMTSGVIDCPLCQKALRFVISPSNGHMAARCGTKDCINAME